MKTSIRNFLREEDGITAIEYGILAALVATALVAAFLPNLRLIYNALITAISAAVTSSTAAAS
jgi:pilus assembly protein Flp/PilA